MLGETFHVLTDGLDEGYRLFFWDNFLLTGRFLWDNLLILILRREGLVVQGLDLLDQGLCESCARVFFWGGHDVVLQVLNIDVGESFADPCVPQNLNVGMFLQ